MHFFQPMETWTNPYDECTTCHCFNNTVSCSRDETCVTTPAPTKGNPTPVNTYPQLINHSLTPTPGKQTPVYIHKGPIVLNP